MGLLKKKRRKPFKGPVIRLRAGCPFCWEWLPEPEKFEGGIAMTALGGRCEKCGAFFVIDETGMQGGTAVFDLQVLACDGDRERAKRLDVSTVGEIKKKPVADSGKGFHGRVQGKNPSGPQIWALKLMTPEEKARQRRPRRRFGQKRKTEPAG